MILPDNGKVVIIDDNRDQVQPLMDALTKEKMPFLFFTDSGGNDLPEDGPINNLRLVFLDLDLGIGGQNPIEKIRIVQGRLERIIQKNTPYVLIIWSSHEDTLSETLVSEFNGAFNEYKPIAHCSLDKSIINRTEINIVSEIRNNLKEKLADFESFNAFLLWESIVNKSVGEMSNELISIFEKNDSWDTNIKNMFYKIAFANLDSESIAGLTDIEKLKIAINTINSTLIDSIENNIETDFNIIEIRNISPGGVGLSDDAVIKLNTRTHLMKSNQFTHFNSGNLYIKDINDADLTIVDKTFKQSKVSDVRSSNPKLLQLDVTPSCDYAGRKKFTRILNGLLVDHRFSKSDLLSGEFLYCECPKMKFDTPMLMVFDFRYIRSYTKAEFEALFTETPKYRLRANLLLDIQAQLSHHFNRPGIITIGR